MSYLPAIDTLAYGPLIAGRRILINHTGMKSLKWAICEETYEGDELANSRVQTTLRYVSTLEGGVLEFAHRIRLAYKS